MELKFVGDDEAPKRTRKSESAFEATDTWKKLKTALGKGLPEPGESAILSFTESDLAEIGISRLAIARFIRKYVTSHDLPLIVRAYRVEDVDKIRLSHREKRTRKR